MSLSWKLMRLLKKLEQARKDGDLLRKSIIEKFVEKDEKGEWKNENGNFIIPDDKKVEFEKEMECFMKQREWYPQYLQVEGWRRAFRGG